MANSQSLQEKVIKGSIITLLLTLVGSIFAYAIRVLYSHNLSVENYGLFYAVFGLFSLFTVYTDLGFGFSMVYFLPKYIKLKNYSRAWNIFIYSQVISLTMSIIISLILVRMAPFLARNYFKVASSEIIIYILCVYLISFTIINGLIQVYSGMQKERYYSSITAFRWFLTLLFSALFLISGFSNITFYAVAWVLGHVLTATIFLILLFYKHSFLTQNKIVWEGAIFRQMFAVALPAILETFVSSIATTTDTFFLTLFKGVKEVGIYNIIYPLAFIPIILLAPINTLLLPLVSHMMVDEKDKLKYLINRILEIVPFVGLYFALFIMMFPSSIVRLIFGEKWVGLVETPLTILSLGTIVMLMNGILGIVTLGTGKIREKLKATAVVAVIGISLNALLIWYYGLLGAVITVGVVALLVSFFLIRIIKSVVPFTIPYLFYLKLLTFAFTVYLAVRLTGINSHKWPEFILLGCLYTVIYFIFGYFMKIYDKKLLQMVLPRKKVLS
ncbi:MAG: oligosaccharide flippase family protein [Candidatus Daviesbacteria bacterium]|nr:oligosaccharide flippase family protein [Candidatus Daviesbacteria bacterium]